MITPKDERTGLAGRAPVLLAAVLLAAPLLAALLVAGCGATEAYVYKARAFDRDAPDFNREPADRTELTICYGAMFTATDAVARLAEAECGRFGRRAVARNEGFGVCPMLTPTEARFDCVRDGPPAPRRG